MGVVLPNGLLPNAGPIFQFLDPERWLKAEERTAELIACIQPNSPSEERRNAVADYVQRLIMKCFPCQVFTFGSVPLKTYLPDGDIDLTAFSNSQALKDTWANQVRDILENEGKNENAEFRVKEVQYIQAEVKLIKCLVENIVVDISFNQLGGLCTLCFLEEVDHLISQNHLFKRSIILIKAWCYYESRVLGAHHGLISTYALETLVLYIFHVFNNSFTGPLEVLYRFLEFFSNFDWDNFCVSLWGPVPITSLPDVTAEPPRKDHGELLLSKLFLDACSSVYAVLPGSQENQGQHFISKHFNVIDPLRINNNLGRSVGKGNFFRIRSAFAFGAKRLARLLDCPKENLVQEVNQFFTNTWGRHGSGNRPDAPISDLLHSRLSTPDYSQKSEISNGLIAKKMSANISDRDTEIYRKHSHKLPTSTEPTPPQSQKVYGSLKNSRVFDQAIRDSNPKNDFPGRYIFARTRSSPDLTDASINFPLQGKHSKLPEKGGKNQGVSTRTEKNGKNNLGSEYFDFDYYGAKSSVNDHLPVRQDPPVKSLDAVKSESYLNNYHHDSGLGNERMDEEEQDLVNMMASNNIHGINGQIHMPLASGRLPFPISPSILASMGYGNQNFPGMVPPNFHFIDPSLAQMQFPQGLVPPSLAQYFPGIRSNSSSDEIINSNNESFVSMEMNPEEEQDVVSTGGSFSDNKNYEMVQPDEPQPRLLPSKFVPSYRNQQKSTKEIRGLTRENYPYQENGNDYPDDKSIASRLSSAGHSSSFRSRTSSESSWDGSSGKVSRTNKEKRGKKSAHMEPSFSYEKIKNISENNNNITHPIEDDEVWDSRSSNHSEPMIPLGPVLLNHSSRNKETDNSGVLFYPTGPPVPFLTMLPFYNVPPESRNSDTSSTSHFVGEENIDYIDELRQQFIPSERINNNNNRDILNSDFASHWQNLLFGRFCQNPRTQMGPMVHPQPVVVPQMYIQGRVPFDGPGRPISANNMNLFTQLIGYGPRLIPVTNLQSANNRPPVVYQQYVEEVPRPRSGTGTYLPNLQNVSPRERNLPGTRRRNYNYERSDNNSDGDRNWNNTKSRSSGRNNNRAQNEKSNSRADRLNSNENRADRPWNSNRRDYSSSSSSSSSYQGHSSNIRSNSTQSATPNMVYSMYPNEVSSNGPNVPSGVMLYHLDQNGNYLDQNGNYEMQNERLAFGSFGPMVFSNSNEQRQGNEAGWRRGASDEQRFQGSSPDQPSSPHFQREV